VAKSEMTVLSEPQLEYVTTIMKKANDKNELLTKELAYLKASIRDSEAWTDDFCIVCQNHIGSGHDGRCPMGEGVARA